MRSSKKKITVENFFGGPGGSAKFELVMTTEQRDDMYAFMKRSPLIIDNRFESASLWGAKQDVWLRQPGRYWAAFDRLMNDADSLQLYVVPSIGAEGWHLVHNQMVNSSFAAGSLEDLNDLVGNQTSIARALARRYYRELVTRYAKRPNLLFCVPADLKPLTLGDSYQPAFIARRSLYRPSSCPISLRRGARE